MDSTMPEKSRQRPSVLDRTLKSELSGAEELKSVLVRKGPPRIVVAAHAARPTTPHELEAGRYLHQAPLVSHDR